MFPTIDLKSERTWVSAAVVLFLASCVLPVTNRPEPKNLETISVVASLYLSPELTKTPDLRHEHGYHLFFAVHDPANVCWWELKPDPEWLFYTGTATWVWGANPMFWAALLLRYLGFRRSACIAALFALIVAAATPVPFYGMARDGFRLSVGYYVWLGAAVLLFVALNASFFRTREDSKGEDAEQSPLFPAV